MAQTKAQLLGPVVGDVVMDVSTLSLDAAGNKVGIGTTGATATLHVFEPTEGDAVVQFNSGDNFPTVNRGLVLKAATGPTGYTGSKWIFDAQSSGGRLEFQTASTPRLTILEGGNIGIGTDNPSNLLHVYGQSRFEDYLHGNSTHNILYILDDVSISPTKKLYFDGGSNTYIDEVSADTLRFSTASQESFRIDSGGRVLQGLTSAKFGFFNDDNAPPVHQIQGDTYYNTAFSIFRDGIGGSGPNFILAKGRGAIVQDDDDLGTISFQGHDGTTELIEGAKIFAEVGGTPGSNNMPTDLVFNTNSGASTSSERLRITSAGKLILTPGADSGNILQLNGADTTSELLEAGITSGHVQFTATYASGGSNTCGFIFRTRGGAGGTTEKLRIDSAGRMGLGVAPSDFGSNRTALEIHSPSATVTHLALTNSTTGSNGASNGFNIIQNGNNALLYLRENANMTFSTNNTERLRITGDGPHLLLGGTADVNEITESSSNTGMVIGSTSVANGGIAIINSTTGTGRIYFGDATGSDAARNRGQINYYHNGDYMMFATAGSERLRIVKTTASVSSTGTGANGIGCVGINEADPATDALSLAVLAPYGLEDPRPNVYFKRSFGIGGGSSTDETNLYCDGTGGSYNSAGVVYSIKSYAKHNLNGSHYAGHFVNHGSAYTGNGSSAVYAETHKIDTNGPGELVALHAKGRMTYTINNSGYATAGLFQTTDNPNGRPIVCLQEYTANTYTHQIEFRKNNGSSNVTVGSIKSNNSATQYNTSSDYRLKENVVSLTGAIDRLKQLQPKRFNFIGEEEIIDGFIAHEVSSTAPYAVSGEKDAMKTELVMNEDGKEQFDENGKIVSREVIDPQSVDYSKLSTLTIAALQEALAKIETLEAKVAALEGS